MDAQFKRSLNKLAGLNIDKYVRKASGGACEENVKIKIVIPLLNLLEYDTQEDMDFEHHVQNKKADIALMFKGKPKLLVETKSLDENLDNHVQQGLDYAFNKGVEWVLLTNGEEIRIYKSFIVGISNPKDRLLFTTSLKAIPLSFGDLAGFVSKEALSEAKKLNQKAESVKENITIQILVEDLTECRDRLFKDLLTQFKSRYKKDLKFKEVIDSWANNVKMNVADPNLIDKLCKEGAYTLINRVLFLRICEDRGHIKTKLSKDSISKWRGMVEDPSLLLGIAFKEIGERFEGLYKSPLFDSISFDDIDWNKETIYFVLDKLGAQDFSKISKDILGRAYEQHISSKERKQLGQFYTPDFVIDYILDRVELSTDKTILDPACGSGGFLMRAYDRLRKQYLDSGWKESLIHEQILKTNLFGIDINPFATQLTVMNLLLKDLNHPTGEINVAEGDTLEKLEEKFNLKMFEVSSPLSHVTSDEKKLTYAHLLAHRPFNIVIGNPPYVSFGLRGVDALQKGRFKFLKANYPNSAEYKISMYAVFMERGLQLLEQGGRFGFVIPDSFLLGRYFSKLRKYILNTCKIVEITLFTKDFWEYGCVGRPVIIILQKEKDKKLRLTNKLNATLSYSDNGHACFKSYQYTQKYFESTLYNRFRLFFDAKSKHLVEQMEEGSTSLGEIVRFASGLIGEAGQDSITNEKKLSADWLPGLLSGSEIQRYSVNYAGNYILYDKSKLHSGFQDAEYFIPKIFMRQTGDSIIASYDENNYLCLNNLHVGKLLDTDYDLKYVLACINSRLLNYYYHLISLEYGRAMAQTDIESIDQLPIKHATKKQQNVIVGLVDKIITLNKKLAPIEDEDTITSIQAKIDKIDEEIDNEICQLYGIMGNQIIPMRY